MRSRIMFSMKKVSTSKTPPKYPIVSVHVYMAATPFFPEKLVLCGTAAVKHSRHKRFLVRVPGGILFSVWLGQFALVFANDRLGSDLVFQ
jgi:hypothetical protein